MLRQERQLPMGRPESGIVPASLIQYVSFCLSRIDTKPTRSRVGRHRTSLYQLVPRATQGRLAALTAMDPLVACSGRSWRGRQRLRRAGSLLPGRVWTERGRASFGPAGCHKRTARYGEVRREPWPPPWRQWPLTVPDDNHLCMLVRSPCLARAGTALRSCACATVAR